MKKLYIDMQRFIAACTGRDRLSEEKMAPLPGTVPLRMSVNTTDLVMGGKIWRLHSMSPELKKEKLLPMKISTSS